VSLLQLQQAFIGYLHGAAHTPPPDMRTALAEGGSIGVEQRLFIYHHAYRARLVEVMQDLFERTWAYLGDALFEKCAHEYIESHPASGRTLSGFGSAFPDWLLTRFPNDVEIAEVARIDWLLRVAFDGPDAAPISMADIAALSADDWAHAGFEFHPTVAISSLTHNAASLWDALEKNEVPPAAVPLDQPAALLVWRKGLRPHFVSATTIEAAAIALLKRGHSFADTCAALDARYPVAEISQAMGVSLRRWVEEEMLIAVRLSHA
jgi:Putative DNA-binding domain